MPLTAEELHELTDMLDKLSREMAVHKDALRTADRRSRWARSAAVIGVIVGALGVGVALMARATADDLAASRREAQISGCVQANQQTQRTRDALIAGVSVLTQPDPRRGDIEQARIDRFVVEYSRHVNAALPYRDCRPAGIEAYYQNPPVDPALSGVPTTTTGG